VALGDIRNYRQAAPDIATSGQPREDQLAEIAAAGYEVVINLALHDDPRYSLKDEASSVQALGVVKELGIDLDRVNVNGGAVAIGHAIGNSGGRVLTTLLHEMKRRGVKRGIAGLCLGGGNSVAMAVERI